MRILLMAVAAAALFVGGVYVGAAVNSVDRLTNRQLGSEFMRRGFSCGLSDADYEIWWRAAPAQACLHIDADRRFHPLLPDNTRVAIP